MTFLQMILACCLGLIVIPIIIVWGLLVLEVIFKFLEGE